MRSPSQTRTSTETNTRRGTATSSSFFEHMRSRGMGGVDGWCCGHTTLIRSVHGHMHFITVPNDAAPRPRFGEATAAVIDAAEILSIEERACGATVVSDVLMCSSASFACAVELCLAHTATSLEGLELRTQPTEPLNAPWVTVEQTKFVLASDGGGRSYGVARRHFSRFVIVQLSRPRRSLSAPPRPLEASARRSHQDLMTPCWCSCPPAQQPRRATTSGTSS